MIIGTTLIVLTWALFVGLGLPVWAGVLITVISGVFILFCMLFGVYFFNLDMKLMAKMQPLLIKLNEKRKRKQREI